MGNKDAIGQDLEVGAEVLYLDVYDGRTNVHKGVVTRLTPKKVGIQYVDRRPLAKGRKHSFLTTGSRLIKFQHGDTCE